MQKGNTNTILIVIVIIIILVGGYWLSNRDRSDMPQEDGGGLEVNIGTSGEANN